MLVVRGCGAGDTHRVRPTFTYIFGTNDPPEFAERAKGSEFDRTTIVYMPNKFVNAGDRCDSPRCFPKDRKLEERIDQHDFRLGHLLNLLQVRLNANSQGRSLDDAIAAGNASSRFWLEKWMRHWSGAALEARDQVGVISADVEMLKNHHTALYNDKKLIMLQCWVAENELFGGSKNTRWSSLLQLISKAGPLGKVLFQMTTGLSRKKKTQPALKLLAVDIFTYDVLFSNVAAFGELASYQYDPVAELAFFDVSSHRRANASSSDVGGARAQ